MRRMTEAQQLAADAEWTLRDFLYWPTQHHYTVGTLWLAAASLRDAEGNFMPYALGRPIFISNEPGTGKSLSTSILCDMCPGGKLTLNPTSHGLASALNYGQVPGIEEVDKKLGTRGAKNQDTMAIILGGYTKGSVITVQRSDQPDDISISGPMILNGNNATMILHSDGYAPFRDRAHVFLLEKPPANHYLVEFDPEIHDARLADMRRRFTKWGRGNYRAILDIPTSDLRMDPRIRNRQKQIWTTLFRVAHYIGGNWPERVSAAAKAFVLGIYDEDDMPAISPADELLMYARSVFGSEPFLPTRELLKRLMLCEGTWWVREWRNPRAASMGLASILGMYDIECVRAYYHGEQMRGYLLEDLEEDNQDNQDNLALVEADAWDWDSLDD